MLSDSAGDVQEKNGRLLLVDDDAAVLQALNRLFCRQYEVVLCNSGEEALTYLQQHSADLIISDMRMPGMDGAELLKQCSDNYPEMIRFLLTGYADLESAIKAVNEGNIDRYIAKPWDNDNLRTMVAEAIDLRELRYANQRLNNHVAEQNAELERLNQELKLKYQQKSAQVGAAKERLRDALRDLRQEFNSMVHLLVRIAEARNGEEPGSSEKLARLAKTFAEFVGFQGEQIWDIYYATLLRNLGKVQLADTLVNKSIGELSMADKQAYARFPLHGQEALSLLAPLQRVAKIIRSHMELYNGKGFPDRLAANAIPKPSRMLRIVSDYADLQRRHNFLGTTLSGEQARAYLVQMAGQRYDPELVDIFLTALNDFEDEVVSHAERIYVRDVQPGMILAANLMTPSGVVLLSPGTKLTQQLVAKLGSMMTQFEAQDIKVQVYRPDVQADGTSSS